MSVDHNSSLRSLKECRGRRITISEGGVGHEKLLCLVTLEWVSRERNSEVVGTGLNARGWDAVYESVRAGVIPDRNPPLSWNSHPEAYWESLLAFGIPALWIEVVEVDGMSGQPVRFEWGRIDG